MMRTIQKQQNHTFFSKDQFQQVTDCLGDLANKLQVSALFLVNSAGQIMAKKIQQDWQTDSTLISTLTASCYSAAKEIARLVGENANFKMVLHEGEQFNVFISAVNENYFLIVVFKAGVAVGMVRLFAKKTMGKIRSVISTTQQEETQINRIITHEFQSLLKKELDQTFKGL